MRGEIPVSDTLKSMRFGVAIPFVMLRFGTWEGIARDVRAPTA